MGSLGVIQTATSAPLALPMTEPEEQGISTTRLALLDALAERYVEEGRVAGMVNVVIRNGNLVYAKATGDRSDRERRSAQAVGFVSHLFDDQAYYRGRGHAAL